VSDELRNEMAIAKPVDPDAFSPPSFFASTPERKRSDALRLTAFFYCAGARTSFVYIGITNRLLIDT